MRREKKGRRRKGGKKEEKKGKGRNEGKKVINCFKSASMVYLCFWMYLKE